MTFTRKYQHKRFTMDCQLFYYRLIDRRADFYRVYGPGLDNEGFGTDFTDERSAQETCDTLERIYWLGNKNGLKA